MNSKALREKRAALAKQAAEIVAKAEAETRNMSAEEAQTFDKIHADVDQLKGEIDRIDSRETRLDAEMVNREQRQEHRDSGEITEAHRAVALRTWLLAGTDHEISAEALETTKRSGLNPHAKALNFSLAKQAPRTIEETRALGVGSGAAGAFTVPQGFMSKLEEALLAYGGVRNRATVLRTQTGAPLPWPTVNDTSNKGVLLAENTTVASQDTVFGQLMLGAYKFSSKMVTLSVELIGDTDIDLEGYLGSALGTRIGRIQSDYFTTGTGTGQPTGCVTGAVLGKTGTTGQTTSVIYDDLVDLEHAVDPAYRPNGTWMLHDSSLKAIKKLKDTQGHPLWQPGIAIGEPDTLLGHPYQVNQSMAVMAANAKSILFGDFSKYLIRDVGDVTLLRLDERFADLHQVAFLAFARADGQLLDAGTHPIAYYANSAT